MLKNICSSNDFAQFMVIHVFKDMDPSLAPKRSGTKLSLIVANFANTRSSIHHPDRCVEPCSYSNQIKIILEMKYGKRYIENRRKKEQVKVLHQWNKILFFHD